MQVHARGQVTCLYSIAEISWAALHHKLLERSDPDRMWMFQSILPLPQLLVPIAAIGGSETHLVCISPYWVGQRANHSLLISKLSLPALALICTLRRPVLPGRMVLSLSHLVDLTQIQMAL